MKYLRYWKLIRRPFLFGPGEDFFAGTPQREALAGLSNFIASDAKYCSLYSPRQNGLSWLFSHLRTMRGFGDRAVEVVSAGETIASSLELVEAPAGDRCRVAREKRVDRSIHVLRRQGVHLVYLLDRPRAACLTGVAELIERHDNLSVIVGGQAHGGGSKTALNQQAALLPLSLEDVLRYVPYCLERAGGDRAMIPADAAVRLHELSGGLIGRLATLAETSIALTAELGHDRVSTGVVESAVDQIRYAA